MKKNGKSFGRLQALALVLKKIHCIVRYNKFFASSDTHYSIQFILPDHKFVLQRVAIAIAIAIAFAIAVAVTVAIAVTIAVAVAITVAIVVADACIMQLICRCLCPCWAGMNLAVEDAVDHAADKGSNIATRETTLAQQGWQC